MAGYADNEIAKTSGYISKESGVGFYNSALLIPLIDIQSKEFGIKAGGARTGASITIKMPAQFMTTTDTVISASTINAIVNDTVPITLSTRVAVHAELDTIQASLEVDTKGSEYSIEVLQPMGKALNSKIESIGFEKLGLEAQNVIVSTNIDDGAALRKEFVKANAMLNKQLAPDGMRSAIVNSDIEVEIADSVLTLFHSNSEIENAYKKGEMGTFGGMKWGSSDLVATRTNGAGGEAGVVASYTDGSDTLVITAATSGDLDDLAVGDKLEFAILQVNPETRKAYTSKVTRAVLAVTGSGATVTVTIDPIKSAAFGARQNANLADATTIVGKAVTVMGVAGKTYALCPVFQKKGITLANADLYLPKKAEMASRNKVLGVSQRFIQDYETREDTLPSRLDSLLEYKLLRPEWVAVVEVQID